MENVDKIDGFIESKANAEEFEVTADEVTACTARCTASRALRR